MPVHIHPIFRARESAMENAGLIQQPINSVGYLDLKYQEDLGATFRQSPKETYLFNGNSFTPPQIPVGS